MSDTESICSNMSDMSIVSYAGEEMDAEKYVDTAFKDCQEALNNIHSGTRNLLQSEDRGDTYEEAKQLFDEIAELVKEGISILKEVVKTNKQFLPPKPRAAKAATAK